MRFVLFYHSLVSDWNHASAHFLRGVAAELLARGHSVRIYEPTDGWSLHNLREQGGEGVVKAFHATYPELKSTFYDPLRLDLDEALADADVVIAHEWNGPEFLRRLGVHRAQSHAYKLLFHDSPHRSLKNPLELRANGLSGFDGVLASSEGLRHLYRERGWASQVWTWRDAVDVKVFHPGAADPVRSFDLIWVGSWGDGERASELDEFLIEPIRALGLRARFYGARYPEEALRTLRGSGIDYGGWIPDFCIPAALAATRFTVHVPRRMQAHGLPHTPAIRALQALACGIPVVSAPWEGCEDLLKPGVELLIAQDGQELERALVQLRGDPEFAQAIAAVGQQAVLARHTCGHRVEELLGICHELGADKEPAALEDSASIPAFSPRPARPQRSHVPAPWN